MATPRQVPVPPRVAVVLHYECCSFPRWRRKYAQLAASHSPADTDAVPFEFYRASIRLAAALVAARDANAEEAAVAQALAHWRQWKLPPPEAEAETSRDQLGWARAAEMWPFAQRRRPCLQRISVCASGARARAPTRRRGRRRRRRRARDGRAALLRSRVWGELALASGPALLERGPTAPVGVGRRGA